VIGAFTTGWMLWFGLLFVVLVMYKPEGLGMASSCVPRFRPRRCVPGEVA
jgi:branched-chain amino acid transport system permease protein